MGFWYFKILNKEKYCSCCCPSTHGATLYLVLKYWLKQSYQDKMPLKYAKNCTIGSDISKMWAAKCNDPNWFLPSGTTLHDTVDENRLFRCEMVSKSAKNHANRFSNLAYLQTWAVKHRDPVMGPSGIDTHSKHGPRSDIIMPARMVKNNGGCRSTHGKK